MPGEQKQSKAQKILWLVFERLIFKFFSQISTQKFIAESISRLEKFIDLEIGKRMEMHQVYELATHLELLTMKLGNGEICDSDDPDLPKKGNVVIFVEGFKPFWNLYLGMVRFSWKKRDKPKIFSLKVPKLYKIMFLNEKQGERNSNIYKINSSKQRVFFALYNNKKLFTEEKPTTNLNFINKKLVLNCLIRKREIGSRLAEATFEYSNQIKNHFVRHVKNIFRNLSLDENCPNTTKLNLLILEESNDYLMKFAMDETLIINLSFFSGQYKRHLQLSQNESKYANEFNFLRFVFFDFLAVLLVLKKFEELEMLRSFKKSFDAYFSCEFEQNFGDFSEFDLVQSLFNFFRRLIKKIESGARFEETFAKCLKKTIKKLMRDSRFDLTNFLDYIIIKKEKADESSFHGIVDEVKSFYNENQELNFFCVCLILINEPKVKFVFEEKDLS